MKGRIQMPDCLFCKIINREIPSQIVYENDQIIIIKDINPVAPIHLLAIPKKHITNVCDPYLIESNTLQALYQGIQKVVQQLGIKENGFRVVSNFGHDAGETIPHFHIHIIAGRLLVSMG